MPIKPAVLRLFAFILILALTLSLAAYAQKEPMTVDYIREESGHSYIMFPRLAGHPDPGVEEKINQAVYADGGIESFEHILNGIDPLGTGLQLRAEASIIKGKEGHGLFTVMLAASGRIGPGRPGHRVIPLMYDLFTGERVLAEDVFLDRPTAQSMLDDLVEREIEPVISDYLYAESLYPVPIDQMLIDESGLTFYYDQEAYTALSGASGAVNFHWNELESILDHSEGSLLSSLVLSDISEHPREMIAAAVGEYRLPGLPVRIGETLDEVLEIYPLLSDSESFPDAEQYYIEDARFRGTTLIVKENRVSGLLSHRMNLWGIITGATNRSQVSAILGEPDTTIVLDESAAEGYGLEAGTLDIYTYDKSQLRLHFDKDMVLRTVWLTRAD